MFNQGVVDSVFHLRGVARQGDEFFGATVVLAALIVHDALAKCKVSSLLVAGAYGGVDIQAARINLRAVLREHKLSRHLCYVIRVGVEPAHRSANFEVF